MNYNLFKECKENIGLSPERAQRIACNCEKVAAIDSHQHNRLIFKRIARIAVAVCMIYMISVPALALNIPWFYDLLYSFSPDTAKSFVPLGQSCVDNGIKMEVVASYIHENTAEIFISVTDIEGDRLDETVDLFDSYDIDTMYDTSACCRKVSYDKQGKTATFLIEITQDSKRKLSKEKITFSVRQLLCGKQQFEGKIEDFEISRLNTAPELCVMDIRGVGSADKVFFEKYSKVDNTRILVPQGNLAQPVSGVTITAVGHVNGELRIQVKYDNIGRTDNHGYVFLKHKEMGTTIQADGSISAFASDNSSSYEEYIFTDFSPENIDLYSLYGYFVTSDTLINGNWKVRFDVEE